jgi:hypothetical protein
MMPVIIIIASSTSRNVVVVFGGILATTGASVWDPAPCCSWRAVTGIDCCRRILISRVVLLVAQTSLRRIIFVLTLLLRVHLARCCIAIDLTVGCTATIYPVLVMVPGAVLAFVVIPS